MFEEIKKENNSSNTISEKIKTNKKKTDNSYYLWFKDSKSTPQETSTMSYEYELLYQAQKEYEYKKNFKIYAVTIFIILTGILAMLLFSPILYKLV